MIAFRPRRIDKLAEARDAGEIEVLTMQEWWERDCSDTSEEDSRGKYI